ETVLSPNVTVAKTADAVSVVAGSQAGFTVTLSNTGLGTANGLTLSDALPALGGSNAWSIDTSTGNFASFSLSGAAGSQSLGLAPGVNSLAAGASLTVHIVGITTPSSSPFTATLNNTATVDASNEVNHNQQASASETVLSPNVT